MTGQLREAPAEVQDAFARARALLDGFDVTGVMSEELADALRDVFELREQMGWDD